jgi:hypothetical protein
MPPARWPSESRLTLSRNKRGGFSAGHSGLQLHRGEHAFTELQAWPFPRAPVEGISKLAHVDSELA